jgi:hypothetical protein
MMQGRENDISLKKRFHYEIRNLAAVEVEYFSRHILDNVLTWSKISYYMKK